MPTIKPLSIFEFESAIADILNQEKERIASELKSTADTCKDVLTLVSGYLHNNLAKDQLPNLLSAISWNGENASDTEKDAEIWKGPIDHRALDDPQGISSFDPKTKSWTKSNGITYDDFNITIFKYRTNKAWANSSTKYADTTDIAVMITLKKEAIESCDVAEFFANRAFIITSYDYNSSIREKEMNAWVMLNGLIDTAVECHWDPKVAEYASAPLIRKMMNHDVFNTCTIKAYASKSTDSTESYTDLDIVVNPDPKIAKKIYKRCFRMGFKGFRPIDNHVRRLAFDMSEYFGKLFALKTRPEVVELLGSNSIKNIVKELEAKLNTDLIKQEIFAEYSGDASITIKPAICPVNTNPHYAEIFVTVKYWRTFSFKADFPIEINYTFKVYFDEALSQSMSSDGSVQLTVHTDISSAWYYFVGPACRVLPGAVIDPIEDDNPENDSDSVKSLKKMRVKRAISKGEVQCPGPYDMSIFTSDIDFLKYMRRCVNSDCIMPWNSDNMAEALSVIFRREMEKTSNTDLLTELIGQSSFGETVTDIKTSTKRKLTADDFDVVVFKYTPTKICPDRRVPEVMYPMKHDSEIVSMLMLSKETLASTDIGDAGYGHAMIHTSYLVDDEFHCNGDELRCNGTKHERMIGAKMRVWAAINGLIDTAIARQWDPGDVVHYSAPLIRRLLGDDIFKAATILANDSKPVGAGESDPYTNLSLIVTIDPEISKNAYNDAIRFVFNGFRSIDKETTNIAEILRLILSTVFNMNKTPSEEDISNLINSKTSSLHDIITTMLADFNYYPTVDIEHIYPVCEHDEDGIERYISVKIGVEYMGTLSCKTDEALKMHFMCSIYPHIHNEGKDDQCMVTITSDWHYDTDACTLMMLPGAEIDHSASVNLANSESTRINPDKYHESSSDNSNDSIKDYYSKKLDENMRYLTNEYINGLLNPRRNKEDNNMNEENEKLGAEAEKPVEEATTNPAADFEGDSQKNEDNPYPFKTSSGICYNYIPDAKAKCCGNTQRKLPMLFKFPNMDDVCVCFTSMKINNDAHERDYSESYMDVSTHIAVNNFRSIGLFTTNNTKLSIYDATGNNSAELMRSYMNNIMWRLNISARISFLKITPAPLNENAAILHFRFGSSDNFGFEKHVNDYGNLYQRMQNAIILMVKSLVLADHVTIMTMSRVHSMNMNGVYSLIYSNATGHEFKNEYYDLFECNFHDALMDICDDMLK